MPKIGGRHFSYSKKGRMAAKAYAKKRKMKMTDKKKGGKKRGY